MLDQQGFLSETNATNLFLVKNGKIYTPFADACLPGITRARVIEMSADLDIPCLEKNLSMTEMYTSDELFTTGTMGGLSWVRQVDGRTIGGGVKGPICTQLQAYYEATVDELGVPIP